jgi:hypothetical protein
MTDAESSPLHAESSAAGIFAAELKAQRGRLGGQAWTSRNGVTKRWACQGRWNGCMS